MVNESIHRPVVTRIDLHRIEMPFSELAAASMAASDNGLGMAIPAEEAWTHGDFLFARIEDADGNEAWAETFVWLPESAVGTEELAIAVGDHLARYVLGQSPFDVRAIQARMHRNVVRNEVAKGLLDQACYQLAAVQIGRPLHDLFGGRVADGIEMAGLLPLVDHDLMVDIAGRYVDAGYRTVRVKLGRSPEIDRDIMTAIRDRVGPDVRLRVDYNQAYSVPDAVRALRLLEPLGVDAAEQPLVVGDVLGMVEVQRQTSIPLFLHEGFFSPADVVPLVAAGGCRVLGINLERPGGITAALDLIDWAAMQGLGTIIHNQCLGLATAVHLHLALARADRLGHAVELAGDVMFAHPLVTDPLEIVDGRLTPRDAVGAGVTIDRDALDDHQVAPTRTVTL